jgi:hypothetical protein
VHSPFWAGVESLVLHTPLRRTLLTAPDEALTDADAADLERLAAVVDDGRGAEVRYDARVPKHAFLDHLVRTRPVLFHGTGDGGIREFRPRRQTDYDNRWTFGVFATDDPIWPLFFAVVNRQVARSLINDCMRRDGRSHYYFSVSSDVRSPQTWRDGWLYILPRETFRPHPAGTEWMSPTPVRPLARLRVTPADFPFLGDVVSHTPGEAPSRAVVRATLLRALAR